MKKRIEDLFIKRLEAIKWHKRCRIEQYESPTFGRIFKFSFVIFIIAMIYKFLWSYFNG